MTKHALNSRNINHSSRKKHYLFVNSKNNLQSSFYFFLLFFCIKDIKTKFIILFGNWNRNLLLMKIFIYSTHFLFYQCSIFSAIFFFHISQLFWQKMIILFFLNYKIKFYFFFFWNTDGFLLI